MLFYSYFKTLVGKEVRGAGGWQLRLAAQAAVLELCEPVSARMPPLTTARCAVPLPA